MNTTHDDVLQAAPKQSWAESIRAFMHPRVVTMLFLGFSAGIPILMIFSSLSLWLTEAGVKKSMVTYFSWAALGYSFKFVWAPLIDKLPVPLLTRWLGRRRSWILVAQLAVIGAILWMAMTDPSSGTASLTVMAYAAVLLGFSSATQDVVIDAYRIESAGRDLQAMMSATYIAGYRIAMIVSGAGALLLAEHFGSTETSYLYNAWQKAYAIMAAVMLIGVLTTLIIKEPDHHRKDESPYTANDYLRFLLVFIIAVVAFIAVYRLSSPAVSNLKSSLAEALNNKVMARSLVETLRLWLAIGLAGVVAYLLIKFNVGNKQMIREAYVAPVKDFFARYGFGMAALLLALVGLYRVSDIVMGVIANVFYADMGYTKSQIAAVSKTFGLLMTIFGGFLGGLLAVRFGVMRILMLGAVLAALTNLLFILLAKGDPNMPMLYAVISADNISAGLASAAFIAFLSSLTNIKFTAMQYAIFSSLMTLFPKILGGYSGSMVELIGYPTFFTITALLTVPVMLLIFLCRHRFNDSVEMA
jgi:PAT family beta-lactamase induction signal transducer AmpG